MRYCALALFTLFVMAGCASTQEVGQIRGDVTTVYGEFSGYKEKTDARLAKLEKQVAVADENLHKGMADLSLSLDNREETTKKIMGRLDELESQLKAYWDETKVQFRELKRAPVTRDKEAVSEAEPVKPPAKTVGEDSYKEAFETFRKGRYEEAIQKFSAFLKQHPNSSLAVNANYWMGESAMALKDYEKAIVYFQEIADKHPKSDRAAKALLRQADAFAATGDKKTSTILLKRIVEVYPKSEEARLADRSLRGGFH